MFCTSRALAARTTLPGPGTELLWGARRSLICNGNSKVTCGSTRLNVIVTGTVGVAHVSVVTPTRRRCVMQGAEDSCQQRGNKHFYGTNAPSSGLFPLYFYTLPPSASLLVLPLNHWLDVPFNTATQLHRSHIFSFIWSVLHARRNYTFPFLLPITSTDVLIPYPRLLKSGWEEDEDRNPVYI